MTGKSQDQNNDQGLRKRRNVDDGQNLVEQGALENRIDDRRPMNPEGAVDRCQSSVDPCGRHWQQHVVEDRTDDGEESEQSGASGGDRDLFLAAPLTVILACGQQQQANKDDPAITKDIDLYRPDH